MKAEIQSLNEKVLIFIIFKISDLKIKKDSLESEIEDSKDAH